MEHYSEAVLCFKYLLHKPSDRASCYSVLELVLKNLNIYLYQSKNILQ